MNLDPIQMDIFCLLLVSRLCQGRKIFLCLIALVVTDIITKEYSYIDFITVIVLLQPYLVM